MKPIVRTLWLILSLLPAAGAVGTDAGDLEGALREAAKRRAITLVEFRAPWCYSCYYMAQHVHTGAEWDALMRRVVFVELDADSPAGADQMKAWNVKALPAYVAFNDEGQEIGRILGEQRRDAFYAQIEKLMGPSARLEDLRAIAARGGVEGTAAAAAALLAFHARTDAAGGIEWFYDLPGWVRRAYEPDGEVAQRLARLRLLQAAQAGDEEACSASAPLVFAADLGCERPYELSRYAACVHALTPDEVMRTQLEPMERLVENNIFGKGPACADERSAVLGLAKLQGQLGEADARTRLLDRAIARTRGLLKNDIGRDRSAADNLRLYLEEKADWTAYDALMPKLIAVWPDDYVYSFRFGRSLLERDRASEALPYLERAAARAYGQNRLRVAELHVKTLKRLGRPEDARRVASEALQANGPWFPELVAAVKSQL
ncbi:MAG: thioredoxin domain-containing protein [Panacagrimonas sp.]